MVFIANFHLEVSIISRGKGRHIAKLANYISGKKLRDNYNHKTYYNRRSDVLYYNIFLPDKAPSEFYHLQHLCDAVDKAEVRYDARTAREFKCSLPNELPACELIRIVKEYVNDNFIEKGFCAIAAIHEGKNEMQPEKNNPHVHIIVPTRSIGEEGFCKKKDREYNKVKYINIWREEWAKVQNRAYERNQLEIQVSHESLEVQGKFDHEPTIHISRIDWQKEKNGERTIAGDKKRDIKKHNEECIHQHHLEKQHNIEYELSR